MKWIRPSGTEIETNDREVTIEYCKSLGWKEAETRKVMSPPKEGSVKKEKKAVKKTKKEDS